MTDTSGGNFKGLGQLLDSGMRRSYLIDSGMGAAPRILDSGMRVAPVASPGSIPFSGVLDAAASFGMLLGGGFPSTAWSPEFRSQLVVAEFSALGWRTAPKPSDPDDTEATLASEIGALLKQRELRAERAAEILHQADSFFPLFHHLVTADGRPKPHTATLIQAAIGVGNMAVLYWKAVFKRARPAQRYPALLPLIPAPGHASYPSGHALQSHLASHLLKAVFLDQPTLAAAVGDVTLALADRITENREVAGVHYRSDSQAGVDLAGKLAPMVIALPSTDELLKLARKEWDGITLGGKPERPAEAPDPQPAAP